MKEADIKQVGNPVLREVARPIKDHEFENQNISQIISDMKSALHDTNDGVAIAAPQIGESVRIFIVNGLIFASQKEDKPEDKIFINPEIINTSREKTILDEGCLSVRGKYGKVERAVKATVRAQDETGKIFQLGASGLLAQIFQHEIDHLDGILFVDKALDIEDTPPAHDSNQAE